MPINCPENHPGYNACLTCRERDGQECWAYTPYVPAMKLSDILTNSERIVIIEDKLEEQSFDIPTVTVKEFKQLQYRLLLLEEKLNKHIDKSVKPKSSYA